jgi:hypothetical protein
VTLRKTRVVDWLTIKNGTGDIHLVLVDEEDWSDYTEHLMLLQEKINGYLAFIEGGDLYEHLDKKMNRPALPSAYVTIEIIARCPLPDEAGEFMKHAEETVRGAGFGFSWTQREHPTKREPERDS